MAKIVRLLKFKTKFFALAILLIVAAYVLAGRYALLCLPDYRADIERYLSKQLDHPVQITSIKSKWVGFDPIIALSGITINGEENAKVGQISVRLATLKSIMSWSPRFKSIQLVDSHIAIEQIHQGEWRVAGMAIQTAEEADGGDQPIEEFARYLDGAEINLHNNLIVFTGVPDENETARSRTWRFPSISMNYRDDEVFASGRVLQPDGNQSLLSFSLAGEGVLSPRPVSGTLYLEARSSEFIDEFIRVYEWEGMSIQSLDASGRIWVKFEDLGIKSVTGDVQVSQMNWKIVEKSLPPIMNVAGAFNWINAGPSSTLSLNGFGFEWAGQACRPSNAKVSIQTNATSVYVDSINVGCISDIAAATGWLSPDLQDRLETSQPDGHLEHVLFEQSAQNLESDQSPFLLQAELNNVGLDAYFSTPMGRGINGFIEVDSGGGSVYFQSRSFELGFPTLFLEPWSMAYAEGQVSWLTEGEEVDVFSDGLRLYMPDNSLIYGDFILRLNPDDMEDYLSLTIGMQDVPFEKASTFVPIYAVGEGLHSWLEESLISGLVTNGIYVGYGATEEVNPDNSFTSSIFLETENGKLLFDEQWPELTSLDSTIYLQDSEIGRAHV